MNLYWMHGLRLLASIFPFFGMSFVYIFCYWLPKRLLESKQQKFEQNIKIGQEITTTSGIIGTVIEKSEKALTIKSGSSILKIKPWGLKNSSQDND